MKGRGWPLAMIQSMGNCKLIQPRFTT